MALMCMSCAHWTATDRSASYAAPCALGIFSGRVPFDTQDCASHSARPPAVAPVVPTNAPPLTIAQMWAGKP